MTAESLIIDAIPWLRDAPEHWMRQRLKYLVHFVSGGTPDTAKLDYWGGSIPWVSPKDMKSLRLSDAQDHITESALLESATAAVPEGTPLLVVRSGILRHTIPVAITGKRMAINQDIKGLVPRNGQMHPEYFARFVEGHNAELLREWRKEGTTVESLEMPLVANFEMVLPPFDEQRAIVRFLDRETARIDALIGKKRRQIELLHEKRAALISHVVTKGLDPNAPLKDSGIKWLDQIPAHWEVLAFKRLGEFQAGAGFPNDEQGSDGEELPFYKVSDTNLPGNEVFMTKHNNAVSKETALKLRAYVFPEETVVFAKVGAALLLNKRRILTRPSCIDNNMMGFMRKSCDLGWVYYWMCSLDLGELANPGAVPSINEGQTREIRVPLPPLSEQCAITAFLDRETARVDALVDKVNLSIDRLREYRTALISAAVTGKIDVREATA